MESLTQTVAFILPTLLIALPQAVVWVVGIAIALMRMERHPRVSRLALAGCGLNLLVAAASVGASALPILLIQREGFSPSQLGMIMGGISVLNGSLHTVASILLLMALFAGRPAVAMPGPAADPTPLV